MALVLLCGVLLTEAVVIGQLRNTVSERNVLYTLFVVAALISVLLVVDNNNLKSRGFKTLNNSYSAAVIASVVIGVLVLLDHKNPSNLLGDTLRNLNKNSNNLFAVSLFISVYAIFYWK